MVTVTVTGATGRRTLILAGGTNDVCTVCPTLTALAREGNSPAGQARPADCRLAHPGLRR
ncbi:hypothetical protein [Streptomyces sp. NPDC048172]|uniref:hypothetical protein n=1 Tax=Streptomyces sp. NPDC048172 TaxID=3365505 RepID=UPI003711E9E5